MSETLEQIEIVERTGRTATARGAFVFHQNGTLAAGPAHAHAGRVEGGWRIAGLLFTY